MSNYFFRFLSILFCGATLLAACSGNSSIKTVTAKSVDAVKTSESTVSLTMLSAKGEKTAVFAGGCFWGVEAVFEHIKGVSSVTSGYSGGTAKSADYETVSEGRTGHAEAVKITYDSSKVSYEQLLKVFFLVAHNPTELNRQGPDAGTQYRSAIFFADEEQKRLAQNYIEELTKAKVFARAIVTQVVALDVYYQAEDYHQDYLKNHPDEPYIIINDQPKVENLRKQFPELYVSK
jgi:peptide-methionine (S)-S-oxide reductase